MTTQLRLSLHRAAVALLALVTTLGLATVLAAPGAQANDSAPPPEVEVNVSGTPSSIPAARAVTTAARWASAAPRSASTRPRTRASRRSARSWSRKRKGISQPSR